MSGSLWRTAATAALGAGLLLVPGARTQEPPPASTFGERIDVTAVTVPVQVTEGGKPVAQLAAADLAVLEDGHPVPVISIERVPAPAPAVPAAASAAVPSPAPAPGGGAVAKSWRILIYVDLQLAGIDSVREAAWKLGGEAERLTRLGEVEVWLADDQARRVWGPGSDADALRKALRKSVANHFGQRRLQRVREDFLESTDRRPGLASRRGGNFDSGSGPDLARASILEEGRLLEDRRRLLQDVLAERSVLDWPQAAFVVSGGFDLVPSEFYLPMVGSISSVADLQRLQSDFASWSQGEPIEKSARQLSALGWTVFPIVPYDTSTSFPGSAGYSGGQAYWRMQAGAAMETPPAALVRKPLEPWRIIGETTGGEAVADVRKLDEALDRLGQRWLVTYQVERPRDGSLHRLEVRGARAGLEVRAPGYVSSGTPEAVAAARARALLGGREDSGDLGVTATVSPLPVEGGKGKRGRLEVKVEFAALGEARQALTSTTLRFTVAVPRSDGGVTILSERAERADLSRHPGWIYTADLLASAAATRVAVVVEEMSTGATGGAIAQWGG